VRHGKGGKDRRTMLPASVREPLAAHLLRVQAPHEKGLAAGPGEAALPDAMDQKCPSASRELNRCRQPRRRPATVRVACHPPSEALMNDSLITSPRPAIPPEVQEFAAQKGVSHYLSTVIDLARQAFPSSDVSVSLGQDTEDERHRYIALDVEAGARATEELLAGQRRWSAGVGRVCPSRDAVYFVLGWR